MAEPRSDHPLHFHTQYIKDLSFENPNAPGIYGVMAQNRPEVSVNIDVNLEHLKDRSYEVTLILRVGTAVADTSAFLVDLQYGALIEVAEEVPEEQIEPLLLTEGPRFIFPFARSTVADVTREGGFPPLAINPVDFERFYAHKLETAKREEAEAGAQTEAAPEEAAPQG